MAGFNIMKLVRPTKTSNNQDQDQDHGNNINPNRRRSIGSINFITKKTWGWKIRDAVASLEDLFGPYLKKIFPSFIAVHYFYIISIAILGSIFIYPVKNIHYIDALFFASGAATQAGLNTLDANVLTLYQQIIIYIFCCLATPIFIHGSLSFLRLYWFERYFDDIRETSKHNFKMRRTATMMARTQSMERAKTAESQRSRTPGNNRSRNLSKTTTNNNNNNNNIPLTGYSSRTVFENSPDIEQTGEYPEVKDSDTSSSEMVNTNPIPLTQSTPAVNQTQSPPRVSSPSPMPMQQSSYNNSVEHISEPSSDDDHENNHLPPESRSINPHRVDDDLNDEVDISHTKSSPNIKFGDLPNPRNHDVEPRDVFMSIAMLSNNQKRETHDDEHEGPALVIGGPAEREPPIRQNSTSAIQFDLKKPKHERKKHLKKSNNHHHRSSFNAFKFGHHQRSHSNASSHSNERDIDSVLDNDYLSDASNDEEHRLKKAQSNLQLPSSDQTGGSKFNKRSNTLDVTSNKHSLLSKSPTFEKMIKQKLKKPILGRRRFSSSAITDDTMDSSGSDTETDDDFDDNSLIRNMTTNYLSWNPKIGRNSTFVNLSEEQKEELGGVEYRAIKLLAKILLFYYVGFHILGFLFLVPWVVTKNSYQSHIRESGVTLTWWGFFTSMSSFNDLGFTLTPDSMNSFNTSIYTLLVSAVLIVIGNTGFPILLRFIIWVCFKFARDLSLFKESLGFLLDHPRRCFTLLFPSAPTWWLLFILVVMNAVDLILFVILDLNAAVVKALPVNIRILNGFYQAISTRTAGFACIDLSQLHPGVQVSYMVMMYISVLPLAISIRRTNVYEEQSLGVYAGNNENNDEDQQKATQFIGAHLRKQLSFDLWFVFMGLFIICIAEGGKIQDDSLPDFNVFSVLFEVVSAYGTVGLSLGYPGTTPSFSGQFGVISKLVIIAMMIRGRHRGLPYSLDRAIMLPSEKMEIRDRYQDLHAGNHLQRAETIGSMGDPVVTFFKNATPNILKNRFKRPSFLSGSSSQPFRTNTRGNSYVSGSNQNPPQPVQFSLADNQNDNNINSNNIVNNDNHIGFKDVHFGNKPINNHEYNQESHELNDLDYAHLNRENHNDVDQGNLDDGIDQRDYSVTRSETFGGDEATDLGPRRNSNVTF
ncbi:High-affinity potassium transport protein [Wickerhamomyces ciferrii]|uniref:Potassium transport protein n=1 Tax=Wickerhamomyces ciferrii (strain ATCC 14091 / BCRC 22168 / CBS 111 / JCM 3599 / NBRC 0793 / NRRL Y-1031 F-60-10) TaxID=1206466 RepID=K0KXT8_WICCF|nr:High-affinity potassium transport protein [Wickerhamomyces ciferrii]CCH46867.1 High-affinity potassium transport protein [Wickerhamomyces ciferrii]